MCPDNLESPDDLEMCMTGKIHEHIWTMLIHNILQTHLTRTFVTNLKIDAIYAFF